MSEKLGNGENKKILDANDPAGQKVLVAMSGGMDSSAVAFLLNKQGMEVIGITISFLNKDYQKYLHDDFYIPRSAKNLSYVKKVCDHLNISHYGVKADREYSERVIDKYIAGRISGEFTPITELETEFMMEILNEKAEKLNVDLIATGHFAKIQRNLVKKEFSLIRANDKDNDQSNLLASISDENFEKLMFPLGDVRKTEVEKILEKFVIPFNKREPHAKRKFLKPEMQIQFIEDMTPKMFREPGTIHTHVDSLSLGDHKGIHTYMVGQTNLNTDNFLAHMDKENVVTREDPYTRRVYVGTKDQFMDDHCVLKEIKLKTKIDKTRPAQVYVRVGIEQKELYGTLYFKNNNCGVLEFEDPVYGILDGSVVTFFNRKERPSRVLGNARVWHKKRIDIIDRVINNDNVEFDEDGNRIYRKVPELEY